MKKKRKIFRFRFFLDDESATCQLFSLPHDRASVCTPHCHRIFGQRPVKSCSRLRSGGPRILESTSEDRKVIRHLACQGYCALSLSVNHRSRYVAKRFWRLATILREGEPLELCKHHHERHDWRCCLCRNCCIVFFTLSVTAR